MRRAREDLAVTSLTRGSSPDNPAFCCSTQRGDPVSGARVDVRSLPVVLYTGFALLLGYVLPVFLLSKAELLINLFVDGTDKVLTNCSQP